MSHDQTMELVKKFRAQWPHLTQDNRFGRAINLVKNDHVRKFADTLYNVHSQSSDEVYVVDTTLHTCTCPDHNKGNVCKHRRAVGLFMLAS